MLLAGLQRADADHIAGDFLALLVADGHHDAVFALLALPGMVDRAFDAHRRLRLGLRFGVDGVEAQMMLAARTDVGALQNRGLAVRTYPGRTRRALPSDAHC